MIRRTQQLLTQLMPTLVGDQVPVAAEALNQLHQWSRGLWSHDVQLVRDSGTDSCESLAATVLMKSILCGAPGARTRAVEASGEADTQGQVQQLQPGLS